MTPAALALLRLCAPRTLVIRFTDPRWDTVQYLIDDGLARIEWSMRGGWAGLLATELGRTAAAAVEDWVC